MTRLRAGARRTFGALSVRNYRFYFFGHIVSVTGTWIQSVAQAWLVLELTGSGAMLGLVIGCQFAPLLVAGPWGGVVADRVRRRRFLVLSQVVSASLALVMAALVVTGAVRLWMVFVAAFLLGCVQAVETPTRQAFVFELVGRDRLPNAVSLNSVVMNSARVVGPAVAGVLITTVGLATCFFVNGISYVAVIAGLLLMRADELIPEERVERARGQLREGLAYVWRTPALRTPLLMIAVIGTFTYNFQITLPLFARFTFGGGPETFGLLMATMSIGAVAAGLVLAGRGHADHRMLANAALAFGISVSVVSMLPTLTAVLLVLPLVGAAHIAVVAQANATLQLHTDPAMRGRVLALWAVAFLGTTPIGGPLVGWVGHALGARYALLLGGVAAIVTALVARPSLLRSAAHLAPVHHLDGVTGDRAEDVEPAARLAS